VPNDRGGGEWVLELKRWLVLQRNVEELRVSLDFIPWIQGCINGQSSGHCLLSLFLDVDISTLHRVFIYCRGAA
jgi:hypothetical protein